MYTLGKTIVETQSPHCDLLDENLKKHRSQRNAVIGAFESLVGTKDYVDEYPMGPHGYG